MSNAPNYEPSTGFATDESNQVAGRATVKTVSLDIEFANIRDSINGINTNLKMIQRADGKVMDESIQPYALSEQTKALMVTAGNPRGLWLEYTDYEFKDIIEYDNIARICLEDHNSGSLFTATYWLSISGDGSSAASAAEAAASAADALASKNTAASSKTAAASSAALASTKASEASTSATNALNSANAAAASAVTAANSIAGATVKSTQPEAEAGVVNDGYMTPLRTAQAIATQAAALIEGDLVVTQLPKSYQSPSLGVMSVIMSNGTVKSWGRGDRGNLPINNSAVVTNRATFGIFSPPLAADENVIDLVLTFASSFALTDQGHVYSCGDGTTYNNLGHGDLIDKYVFTRIEYFVDNTITIEKVFASCSRYTENAGSSFFISDIGEVYACGYNAYGQLGIGTTSNISEPELISGAISGVDKVICDCATYFNSAYLLTSTGLVYSAGYNNNGQLGVGDTSNRTAFSNTGLSNVAKLAKTAGFHTSTAPYTPATGHALVLKNDGTVLAAGYNGYGQLGINSLVNSNSFASPTTLPAGIVDIGTFGGKYGSSWAIDGDGALWTCGYNGQGGLGHGNTTNLDEFTEVLGWSGAGAPPWNDKIAKIETTESGTSYQLLIILDTDGNLYVAGNTYVDYTGLGTGNKTLFTPILMPRLQRADEKIIDVKIMGYDAVQTIFALSNYGTLYACGDELNGLPAGGSASTEYAVKSLRKVPDIIGYN